MSGNGRDPGPTGAGEAFRNGDLPGAIAAATAAVKKAPTDANARWLLAEMLLFAGEADRADKMLDAAALQDPNPAVLEFRKLLRAEVMRGQCWREGRLPKFQGDDPTPAQRAAMQAAVLLRAGDAAGALAAAEEAESLRPRAPGEVATAAGTVAFDDLRDVDDLFAPNIEVLTTNGDHILVPVERIRSLSFDPPRRPRDLCWRRCALDLRDGTEGVVYLPAIYPWSDPATPDALKLGRATEWSEEPGPVRGSGARLLLVGEEALSLAEITSLSFAG
ncbi:tetratricopeptide repeat protein [Roseomonas sp. NAR14]|uniref:Tetratricopeptide repeat protein n=1 Tax=Roseomonas acroporae TaxID=2937791 RepID=A0A9X2BWN5_9PROT|nr:type VI secretion system accessory protein TagJ [Roseomonas acroporae]MCK8785144.1 tetratricopeptide repeat protein [Roseomonas acroporae]